MGLEVIATSANFQEEVLDSPIPVLADFWAEWCVPCKMVAPVLEKLADDYKDKIKVAKVDVDQEGDLASQYNIVSIPSILLFHEGKMVKQQIGAVPRKTLEEMIKEYIE